MSKKSVAASLTAVSQSAGLVDLGSDPRNEPNHQMAEYDLYLQAHFQVIDIQDGANFLHRTQSAPAEISPDCSIGWFLIKRSSLEF